MTLTVHGLQPDQAGDKVVKVDSHVGLRVAQDDQLEQVVGQLETWEETKNGKSDHKAVSEKQVQPSREQLTTFFYFPFSCVETKRNSTCRLKSHPHLIGAHGARFVQVELPEYSLAW